VNGALVGIEQARTRPWVGEGTAPRYGPGRRLVTAIAVVLAFLGLLAVYVRLSQTRPVTSNSANIVLMASDMLHGNLLLHGWAMSDVSFYTTEIPQYALLEIFLGLHPETAHVAAAMTYTLAVLLAVLLALGPRWAGNRLPRALIAGGIMVAPQLGAGVANLDLAVGHIGTSVPLLLIWLLLDRAGAAAARWVVPATVAVLLAWALVADPLVLLVGVAPLVLVAGIRIIRGIIGERGVSSGIRACWDELLLGFAAVGAVALAWGIERLLRALGGYVLQAIPFTVSPSRLGPQLHATFWCVLQLFGADPRGFDGAWHALALAHLISVVVVGASVLVVFGGVVFGRVVFGGGVFGGGVFGGGMGGARLVDQVLAVAIVLNVAVFALTTASGAGPHELAVIVPFGAALAARTLARGQRAVLVRYVAGACLLAGYLAGLGCELTQPAIAPDNSRIATWLAGHHLADGLGVFRDSSSITVDSGGLVRVRPLETDTLPPRPRLWMANRSWYDPRLNRATFLVFRYGHGSGLWMPSVPALSRYFGPPARIYRTGWYLVLVWDKNLLRDVRLPARPPQPAAPNQVAAARVCWFR
jgi:hypothetical protein